MDTSPTEWLNLILRWTHVIAAIAWIGHAFLFNELDENLVPPERDDPRKGLEGELWMVHGGGFYKVEKSWTWPVGLRGALKWFKWEAGFTWLSGFLLLVVVFYLGGGVYLVDPSNAWLPLWGVIAISVGSLVLGWVVYDLLCRTPLGRNGPAFAAVGLVAVLALAWGLVQVMSGRAAYLHVGAILATIMTANVWMLIIPTMRKMVAAAKGGESLDIELGKRAKQRSRHNNYLVFPVIFLMISNHYPSFYAHDWNWALLGVMVVIGGAVKHVMNVRGDGAGPWLAGAVAAGGAVVLAIVGSMGPGPDEELVDVGERQPIDPAQVGQIVGEVRFEGEVPAPREVVLINCPGQAVGPTLIQNVKVEGDRLADVFVWVREGAEGWEVPPVPEEPVYVDQVDCIYTPHVVGARVNQDVHFLNSDPVPHNVRTVADWNATFNEMMISQDSVLEKVFRRPEVMVTARCDVHPWMAAYIGVVPHPWFDVTPADGAFAIEELPPGDYLVEAWHEVYGTQQQRVTLEPEGAVRLDFTFGPE